MRLTIAALTDDGGLGKAVALKARQDLGHGLGPTCHQQSTAGLRVGQQCLLERTQRFSKRHLAAITRPVQGGGEIVLALCWYIVFVLV